MKYMRKFAMAFCAAALGMFTLTSCEGGDLYNVDSPDWLSGAFPHPAVNSRIAAAIAVNAFFILLTSR